MGWEWGWRGRSACRQALRGQRTKRGTLPRRCSGSWPRACCGWCRLETSWPLAWAGTRSIRIFPGAARCWWWKKEGHRRRDESGPRALSRVASLPGWLCTSIRLPLLPFISPTPTPTPIPHLHVHRDLAEVAAAAALHQRALGGEAHAVDVAAGLDVVQRVEDQVKALVKGLVEALAHDVGVVRDNVQVRVEAQHALAGHDGLGLADVLLLEQKLAVEVCDLADGGTAGEVSSAVKAAVSGSEGGKGSAAASGFSPQSCRGR